MRLLIAVLGTLLLLGCRRDAPATAATPAQTADAPHSVAVADAVAPPPASIEPSPGTVPGPALPPPDIASTTSPADAWLGRWVGPEGTLLQLSRRGAGYDVTIQSLDGPATYPGVPVGDHVEFTRAGKRESIIAGDGAATGMKWLADKRHCLVIQAGEGFCRD